MGSKILKGLAILVLGLVGLPSQIAAQTYHYPALETNNTFLGTNTFDNSVYLPALTIGNCLYVAIGGVLSSQSCAQTPSYSGLAASNGSGTWITPTAGMVESVLGYTPLNPANNLSDVGSASTSLFNLGGQPVSQYSTTDPPTLTCSSTVNKGVFVASTTLKLYQCSNNNVGVTYAWNNVGSSGLSPSAPAYSVQFANSSVSGLGSDSQITINPTAHTLSVGGAITGNRFTLTALSTVPGNWTLDVTTPATALASFGAIPIGSILGPTGTTNCLGLNGSGVIITRSCSGAGTVSSVAMTVPTQMTLTGSPITATGTFALGLNTTGTETKVVTSAGAGASGNYAKWDSSGGIADSGIPVAAFTATDYYWTVSNACSTGGTQPVQCPSSSIGTTTLPGAMPDANYQIECTADIYSYSGSAPNYVCSLKNGNPLPYASGSTLYWNVTQVMSDGGTGGSVTLYFHAHHN